MAKALYNKLSDIPQELLLGSLVFVNLTDMKIPAKDMETIFRNNNIPEKYVRKISPSDAYRRATSSVKNMQLNIIDSNGCVQQVKVEVDEVKCDANAIKRMVGLKKIDMHAEDVDYEKFGEIVFNRANNTCTTLLLKPDTDTNIKDYKDVMDIVKNRYNEWSVYHNKTTVRNIINRIISDMHPVGLMPTGVCKFIPKKSMADLHNLKNALYEMSAYACDKNIQGNIMEILPLIDTEEQRQLVKENFEKEMQEELFDLTQKIKNSLVAGKPITSRTMASYTEKFSMLKEKINDYSSLMDIYTGAIESQLKAAIRLVNDAKNNGGEADV